MKKIRVPVFVIILVIIVIIGGAIFALRYFEKNKKTQELSSQEPASGWRDSDNDGLKDWEEELYRTDPNNPDTDNDGYLDGEEINSGHNPLVKAPGDELGSHPLPLGEKYNITSKVFNEASVQKILTSYLSQKAEYLKNHPEINDPAQFSDLTDSSTIKEMAEKAVENSYVSELSEIFDISIADEQIKISNDNSKQAIEIYIYKISQWLNSDIFFFQNEALQIVSNALNNEDFNNLDRLIKLNDAWIDQMKEITVPSSWKAIHKQGLKMIILSRNVFVSLRDYQNDPIKAYYAANALEDIAEEWTNLIKQAINLAQEQGVDLPL